MVLNGESIRGAELVTIKQGQKVPISYDEDCIVFYVDPTTDISVVEAEDDCLQTNQSFELHLVVYGNQTKKLTQSIKSNFYTEGVLSKLRNKGIGLLHIDPISNISEFINSTYVLRSDLRISFDCVFYDEKKIEDVAIENAIGTINTLG